MRTGDDWKVRREGEKKKKEREKGIEVIPAQMKTCMTMKAPELQDG